MKKLLMVSGIVIVVAVVLSGLGSWAGRMLEREAGRVSDGRVTLSLKRVEVNVFRREVVFKGVEATISPAAAASPDGAKKTPSGMTIRARGIVIDGLDYSDNKLTVGELRIRRPWVKRGGELQVGVGRIVVNRLDTIEGVAFAQGRLTVAHASHYNMDESVCATIDSLAVDMAARTVSLGAAAIEPTYPKQEFTVKSWNHGDWTQVAVEDVECSGVMFAGGRVSVDSVHIPRGAVASYKDRNTSENTAVKPMYHTIIQRIRPRLDIRAVAFDDIDICYEELPVGGDEAGVLTVDGISGAAAVVPGTDGTVGAHYVWEAAARLQAAAPLHVRGRLPLEDDDFALEGTLGECRAEIFNSMAAPLGKVEISGGRIRRLDFGIAGDSVRAHAEVILTYNDLSVEILDRHHHDRELLSEIVNDILPHNSGDGRPVDGKFERDPMRSPWNYLWKTVFAAVKATVAGGL